MPELPRISSTVSRLRALAQTNDAKTYLEIGVEKGSTFLNASFFELRHGVDPHFRFDVEKYESSSVRCFEMTSDEFFVSHADPKQKYDVIFLDGRHTFEQTFRDFCCSNAHATDQTIWILDDIAPSDIFSAHRDTQAAYRYREAHGLQGKAWTGDVFKVVFAIHDFFPNLSYHTTADGKPQTVVIRRARTSFAPLFNDLERISRMTYYDFVERRECLNLASEDDITHWISS